MKPLVVALTARRAGPNDAAAYRALRIAAAESSPVAFADDIERLRESTVADWDRALVNDDIEDNPAWFVLDDSRQLVGTAMVVRQHGLKYSNAARIHEMYIMPSWRGNGGADLLLHSIFAWVRAREVLTLTLVVAADNAAAVRAYLRAGFLISGIDRDAIRWDDRYIDQLRMYRRVQGATTSGAPSGKGES